MIVCASTVVLKVLVFITLPVARIVFGDYCATAFSTVWLCSSVVWCTYYTCIYSGVSVLALMYSNFAVDDSLFSALAVLTLYLTGYEMTISAHSMDGLDLFLIAVMI